MMHEGKPTKFIVHARDHPNHYQKPEGKHAAPIPKEAPYHPQPNYVVSDHRPHPHHLPQVLPTPVPPHLPKHPVTAHLDQKKAELHHPHLLPEHYVKHMLQHNPHLLPEHYTAKHMTEHYPHLLPRHHPAEAAKYHVVDTKHMPHLLPKHLPADYLAHLAKNYPHLLPGYPVKFAPMPPHKLPVPPHHDAIVHRDRLPRA